MVSKALLLPIFYGLGAVLAGCDVFVTHTQREPVYVASGPQYVEAQPPHVIVDQPPPAVIVERAPPPPSPTHIWIEGHWNWSGQRYNWEAGRYVVPPEPDVVWVAPRYESAGRGYRYVPGQWKKAEGGNNGRGRGRGRGN